MKGGHDGGREGGREGGRAGLHLGRAMEDLDAGAKVVGAHVERA